MESPLNFSEWLHLDEGQSKSPGYGGTLSPHYRGNRYRYIAPSWDIGSYDREGKPLLTPGGTGEKLAGSFVGDAKEKIGSYFYGRKGRPPTLRQNLYLKNTFGGTSHFDVEVTPDDIKANGNEVDAAKAVTLRGLTDQGQNTEKIDWDSFKVTGEPQKSPNGNIIVSAELRQKQNYKRHYKPRYHYDPDEYEDEEPEERTGPDVRYPPNHPVNRGRTGSK